MEQDWFMAVTYAGVAQTLPQPAQAIAIRRYRVSSRPGKSERPFLPSLLSIGQRTSRTINKWSRGGGPPSVRSSPGTFNQG